MSNPHVLTETLSRLRQLYTQFGLTPGTLRRVAVKQGWNVVIGSDGQCGMAMNFTGWERAFGEPQLDFAQLQASIGDSLFNVAAGRLDMESWQERSIGVAAMSALSQPLLTPASLEARGFLVSPPDVDFASLIQPEDVVAIVGYGGAVARSLGKCKELHVLDMRSRESVLTTLVTEHGVGLVPTEVVLHPASEDEAVLGKATAVTITGSALVNGTFDSLLQWSAGARLITVYGASAGFIPDVLFERGVHMLHSSRITDPEAFDRSVVYDMNMEWVMQKTQQHQTVRTRS
jgi:uncharacterized protein